MVGFDFKNSILETGFRHGNYYADYGAEKISRPTNTDGDNKNTTYNQTTYAKTGASNQPQLKQMVSRNDIKGAFNRDFIDKTVNNYNATVIDTITDDEDDNKHKLRKAFVIGTSTLLFGGISLLLIKGKVSSKVYKFVDKLKNNITNKITEIKEKPETSKAEGVYLSGLQAADKAFSRIQGTLFNISPIKDVLFEKVVREKLGLGKACDFITNGFKKVSFGTVKSMYNKASKNINTMTGSFVRMNERIAGGEFGQVDKSVTDSLDKGVKKINSLYNESFTDSVITKRSDNLSEKFKGLGGKVYDAVYGNMKNFIKDTDQWSTFISEKMVAGDKAKVMADLSGRRRAITNTPKDVYNEFADSVDKLEKVINPNDKGSRDFVKTLREQAGLYLNPEASSKPQTREEIAEGIKETVSKYVSGLKGGDETAAQKEILKQIENIMQTDKKGAVEQLLTEYKKILPEAEYNELKKSADKASKSLNKAVFNEGNNYTDKLRDLSVGSALTDVAIGTAVPVMATGIAITAADTKEKKRSVLLKYGIPLMVGIATTTTCALKLISGGRSLIFGTITSTLANNVCEKIDKHFKSKSNSEQDKPKDTNETNVQG